jgi:hypothetical protein
LSLRLICDLTYVWLVDRVYAEAQTDRLITGFARVLGVTGAGNALVPLVSVAEERADFDTRLEQDLLWEREREVLLRMVSS